MYCVLFTETVLLLPFVRPVVTTSLSHLNWMAVYS